MLHAVPFQCSVRVPMGPPPLLPPLLALTIESSPTAQMSFAEMAVTLLRIFTFEEAGLGLLTTLHAEPFQSSTSVIEPVFPKENPTAQTLLAEIAVTPYR